MNLDEVRVKINDINDQMLALFKERMELSKDVAAAKKEMIRLFTMPNESATSSTR